MVRNGQKINILTFTYAEVDYLEWPFNWATTKCIADALLLYVAELLVSFLIIFYTFILTNLRNATMLLI